MSDPLIIQTLKQKRAEISGVIAAYQAKIAQARHDLAHTTLWCDWASAASRNALSTSSATVLQEG